MSIEQTIKQTATAMGLPYFLGSYPFLNKTLDFLLHEQRTFPLCLNIQSTTGAVTLSDGAYYQSTRESQDVTVAFADRIPFDYEPETVQAQIEGLKAKGADMLVRLNGSGRYQPVDTAAISIGFDEFDANLVLVLFTFTLTEREGGCSL